MIRGSSRRSPQTSWPRHILCGKSGQVTHVQIAIQDRAYAEELGALLAVDGERIVHIVEHPTPAIEGIVVVDEDIAKQFLLSERCVVLVGEAQFQADELFCAGVRYIIHAEYAPYLGFLIVLAAERGLNQDATPERPGAPVKALESQPNASGDSSTLTLWTYCHSAVNPL